jgi:hypothetical protein
MLSQDWVDICASICFSRHGRQIWRAEGWEQEEVMGQLTVRVGALSSQISHAGLSPASLSDCGLSLVLSVNATFSNTSQINERSQNFTTDFRVTLARATLFSVQSYQERKHGQRGIRGDRSGGLLGNKTLLERRRRDQKHQNCPALCKRRAHTYTNSRSR